MNGMKMTDIPVCAATINHELDESITSVAIVSGSGSTTPETPDGGTDNAISNGNGHGNENKPLHHQIQQQQNKDPNSDNSVQDQHERLQFTIGKKRRKSPIADGRKFNKRSAHSSNLRMNVLENDDVLTDNNISKQTKSNQSENSAGGEENDVKDREETTSEEAMFSDSDSDSRSDTCTANNTDKSEDRSGQVQQCQQQQLSIDSGSITSSEHRHSEQEEEQQTPHDHSPGSRSAFSATANKSNNAISTKNRTDTPSHTVKSQPEGWRVKLYRLNADGSWDDCGTGRIGCLVSNGKKNGHGDDENAESGNISSITNANAVDARSDDSGGDGGKEWASLEEDIYQTLGEPTLCMHAEVPGNSQLQNLHLAALINKAPKVLLRTRVLLRESYQRQGDNIITWCEPFFLPAPGEGPNQGENDPSSSLQSSQQGANGDDDDISCGVDLALSFQDNAGCREIWNKISKIQHKAYELFEARGGLLNDGGDEGLQEMSGQLMNHHGSLEMSEDEKDKDLDGNPIIYAENREASNSVGSPLHPSSPHSHNDHHRDLWGESTGVNHSNTGIDGIDVDEHDFMETNAAAVSMAAQAAHYVGGGQMGKNQVTGHGDSMEFNHPSVNAQLCNPPTLDNLEKIADVIAASQVSIDDERKYFNSVFVFSHSFLYCSCNNEKL
jgi:hypothetical protein